MQIIYFILLLGVIILVHEIGHLLVAKFFGVYCGEFAIGMGPKLFSIKKKETTYSIRAIPIGGFVTMAGDDFEEKDIPVERTLPGIHPLKRIAIMLAGIVMNFLLAWIVMSSIIIMNGSVNLPPEPVIIGVIENSPASEAGLQEGDIIRKIEYSDGTVIHPRDFYEILNYNSLYTDERMMTIERDGKLFTIKITPAYFEKDNQYLIGIPIPPSGSKPVNFIESFQYGAIYTANVTTDTFNALTRLVRGIGLNQLSGPIGILNVTGEIMSQANSFVEGLKYFLNLVAVMSANVAIFNLLPLPIMDGGRVLITVIEMIIRKPVNKKLEQMLMLGSMALMMLLMLFVTYQDIFNIFK